MKNDYLQVTEVSGDDVTQEQVQRMFTRYHFARQYCDGKDVLELGCGCGQGLGYLAKAAKSIVGGDFSGPLLRIARGHYQGKMPLLQLDAQVLPFKNQSFDVIILFEAIYYLKDCETFLKECLRIIRSKGTLLICNPNKDLPDFNPSPYTYRYFSAPDFVNLLAPFGFKVNCSGDCPVDRHSVKQKLLSAIKKTVVRTGLMPKTMAGKKTLKRIVFGQLVPLPAELTEETALPELPTPISSDKADTYHKVIFAVAQK